MIRIIKANCFRASVIAAAVSMTSTGAIAAGLGKFTVLSQLGQPLRAELDVSATREELASLQARVAPHEAFKQLGIEFAPALAGLRFSIDKHSDGRPFIRVTTDRPVNDPFLNVLIEVTWSSGRVVREYTALLDPPVDTQKKPVVTAVAAPEVRSPAPAPVVATTAPVAPPAPVTQATEPAPVPAKEVKPAKEQTKESEPSTRMVEKGDTLVRIAAQSKPDGVSLDQMLVALYRNNRGAFDGDNMNRLRVGRILTIPDVQATAEVPAAEARKTVASHASDFNAYRQRLAGAVAAAAPTKDEGTAQAATGKISPNVNEATPPVATGQDALKVSPTQEPKSAQANKALQTRISSLEEDLVARERALKEANGRILELEKNVADLKKLAELKNQAAAQPPQPKEELQPAKTAETAPPVPVADKPTDAAPAKAEQAPSQEEAKPAPETVAPPPPAVVPAPPKPVAPPPPPAPEPSFIEENSALVYGGGSLLVALLGLLGFRAWKRKKDASTDNGPVTSRITEGDLTANSVFGSTGGQTVDTGASIQTDFSQSSLGALDADEGVDPVAEADVYMAYGRDAQAEEILIDALKNDPARHAISLKLLEIYAARKSLKQFEEMASNLLTQTGGVGPDWEKAASMGRIVDPGNPLYTGGIAVAGGEPAVLEGDQTTIILPSTARKAADLVIPQTEMEKSREPLVQAGNTSSADIPANSPALDFDLDLKAPVAPVPEKASDGNQGSAAALDFNLDLKPQPAIHTPPPVAHAVDSGRNEMTHLNLDMSDDMSELSRNEMTHLSLDLSDPSVDTPRKGFEEPTHINVDALQKVQQNASTKATTPTVLDFEFDLGTEAEQHPTPDGGAALEAIDLDDLSTHGKTEIQGDSGGELDENPDVTTKLELAHAYEEMGDKEGARELLQEVLNEGNPRQQEIARNTLAALEA